MCLQVLYLVNEEDDKALVNGARGVVTGFDETGLPMVTFADGVERTVFRHSWEWKPDPRSHKVTAVRSQIPLKLAWAISIHKSQGMSINCLEVFLDRCWLPGQSYVALSRATCEAGLRVHVSSSCLDRITVDPRVVEFDETM
jgi:ATP-dependent DNA helicase PIF1